MPAKSYTQMRPDANAPFRPLWGMPLMSLPVARRRPANKSFGNHVELAQCREKINLVACAEKSMWSTFIM